MTYTDGFPGSPTSISPFELAELARRKGGPVVPVREVSLGPLRAETYEEFYKTGKLPEGTALPPFNELTGVILDDGRIVSPGDGSDLLDMVTVTGISARSQKSAYSETGDISSVCLPCKGPVRIEAYYDDPWRTPITLSPVRIEDSTGVVLPGTSGGPTTLGLMNFGSEDGQPPVPSLRPELGTFYYPQVQRGPVKATLVPEMGAQKSVQNLEAQILADLRTFSLQMQTALQPWISEWESSGWWGVLGSFFEGVKNGAVAWWEGEGDFWESAWEAITNIPDAVVDGIQAAGGAAIELWNNKDRIFELMQAFSEGAITQIENLMTTLANVFRNIPGLEEIAGLFVDLVENSAEWAKAMIEMATQTRVLSGLFMTMGGTILMAPPNFWADTIGKLGGYLIPEVIIALIFAVIAFFTAGTGGSGLAFRLSSFVTKVTSKLAGAGRVGTIVLRVFSKLASLGGKIKDLVRILKRNIKEVANGFTDATTAIIRRTSRLREAYRREVRGLSRKVDEMRAAGHTPEEIARTVSADRRALGVKYKDLTPPDVLEKIYARNMEKYGDPLGPTVDHLRRRGKTWEQIIESATRPGGGDLGL